MSHSQLHAFYKGKKTLRKNKNHIVIYRPKADYLNIGQISGMNLLEMQAYVWRCVCVCVWGGGVLFVCMCGLVCVSGRFWEMKGSAFNFTGTFYT